MKSKNLTKLGTMHLLAVNIWTWLRFVIAKNAALERPRRGNKGMVIETPNIFQRVKFLLY